MAAGKNILIFSIDDLNCWPTSKDTYPGVVHTPRMDELASLGTTFENAHVQIALCNPSRASAWTGTTPATNGVHTNPPIWFQFASADQSMHALMKQAGYETVGAGKIYHSPSTPVINQLFDTYTNAPEDPGGDGPYQGPIQDLHDYQNATTIINFLNSYDPGSGKPFFVTLGISRPHSPNVVPQAYYDLYPVDQVVLPNYLANDLADVPDAISDNDTAYATLPTAQWKAKIQSYLAGTSYADAVIGRVIDALQDNGLADSTTIVLWSDNGIHFGEKDTFDKHTLWDPATKVPFIIVDPDVGQPGQTVDRAVEMLDLMPTLFQLVGLPVPAHAEGRSLVPLITDPATPWTGEAVSSVFGSFSLRADEWRYTRYFDGQEELYAETTDPNEWTNLIDNPNHTWRRDLLASRLDTYFADHSIRIAAPGTVLNGTPRRDVLINATSNTTLVGGAGDDTYIMATGTKPVVREDPGTVAGNDLVLTDGTWTMAGNIERAYIRDNRAPPKLTGNPQDNAITGTIAKGDTLNGADGNDRIFGVSQNDLLIGGNGNNSMDAGAGDDTLRGGPGRDILSGGPGRDTFDFNAITESAVGTARDVINGFDAVGPAAGDIVDLTGIDANLLVGGDQAFAFIGVAAFTGPAQVRVMNVGANTAVQINNNGGLAPDMEIQVNDGAATAANWVAADFAL